MDPQAHPPLPELSRRQIWIALGITTGVLLVISGLWSWLGQIKTLPLHWDGPSVIIGLTWGLGIVGLSHGVYRLWPAYQSVARHYMTMVVNPLSWADVIWIGILPGFAEELLFRGVALAILGTTPTMILLTSLIFGALHILDLRFWPYGVWATLVGILMSVGLVITGNLLVPILAHMLTNILAGYTWKLQLVHTQEDP